MNHRRFRLALLITAYSLFAIHCVRGILFPKPSGIELLNSIAIAIVVTLACIEDSHVLKRPMVRVAQWLMVFTWPVAVPIYLIWSRGARGFRVILLHVALIVGTYVVVAVPLLIIGYGDHLLQ